MRQALEKHRPTLTYNCKPYQNPITRPLEPEKGKLATKSLEGPLNKINHNKIPWPLSPINTQKADKIQEKGL